MASRAAVEQRDFEADCRRGAKCLAWYRAHFRKNEVDDPREFKKLDWLRWRLVKLQRWCVAGAMEKLVPGLVASQLVFYLLGKMKDGASKAYTPEPDRGLPGMWVAVTAKSFAMQTGLTAEQCEYAFSILEASGFIGRTMKIFQRRGPLRGKRCSHVWLGPLGCKLLADVKRHERAGAKPMSVPVYLWAMRACGGDVRAAVVLGYVWYRYHYKYLDASYLFAPPLFDSPPVTARDVPISRERIATWTGISMAQVKRAMGVLRARGLITTSQHRCGIANVNHVALDYDRCAGFIMLTGLSKEGLRRADRR